MQFMVNPFENINQAATALGVKPPSKVKKSTDNAPQIRIPKTVGRDCPLNVPNHIKRYITGRKNYTTVTVDVEFRTNLSLLESAFAYSKDTYKYYLRTLKMEFQEFRTGRDKVYLTWRKSDKPYYIHAMLSFKPNMFREVTIIEELDEGEIKADGEVFTKIVFTTTTARTVLVPLVEPNGDAVLTITS